MNIKTKAQHVLESLYKSLSEVRSAISVMEDADISVSMWTEIKGIELNLNAVIYVLEERENAK